MHACNILAFMPSAITAQTLRQLHGPQVSKSMLQPMCLATTKSPCMETLITVKAVFSLMDTELCLQIMIASQITQKSSRLVKLLDAKASLAPTPVSC